MQHAWIALAGALVAIAPAASLACGACDEDKIAATYDHAVIDSAVARHRQVVFVAIDGPVDAKRIGARLAADFPEVNAGSTWRTISLNGTALPTRALIMMAMLIGLSGFVLLIACSNLANLLLARTMARAREFAVRSALGASRAQLLRPLIAESLLLAVAGGFGAILVARWAADWLSARTLGENGEGIVFTFDWHVFGWAFVASLVTAVAFGLAPALFALRLNVNDTLKSGARGMTGGRGQQRFRHALIVGQFTLAMVLLTGAALSGMRKALEAMKHSMQTGEAVDRPDLTASIEDITDLMGYSRIAELEQAFMVEEDLERRYGDDARDYVVRGATRKS